MDRERQKSVDTVTARVVEEHQRGFTIISSTGVTHMQEWREEPPGTKPCPPLVPSFESYWPYIMPMYSEESGPGYDRARRRNCCDVRNSAWETGK